MDMGADVRHATHSAVPSGLRQFQISVPNVETLGYYRPSLRDDEWQILVALDSHVRANSVSMNARTPLSAQYADEGVAVVTLSYRMPPSRIHEGIASIHGAIDAPG